MTQKYIEGGVTMFLIPRDVLTITTSQLAAVFARRLEAETRPGDSRRKGQAKLRRRVQTPRFEEVSSNKRFISKS